jgi:YebC/PmpR family DNA-binding regulatory protein
MSGHSHWATIKHKKGSIDAKRGKLWSKLSRAIIVAAKHGGGDPTMNLKLRYAIDKAREVSMPRDNIDRAIKRGTGDVEGASFDEFSYEGYGPGGIAVMVDVLTDNRNRTNSEIRKIFERGGGNMGAPGCVSFLFERKGVILIDAAGADEDTLMAQALEAGADDMKRDGANFQITCDPTSFSGVKDNLETQGVKFLDATLTKLPKSVQDVDTEKGQQVMRLIEALDDHDDVQNVYTNLNVTDAMMAEAGAAAK